MQSMLVLTELLELMQASLHLVATPLAIAAKLVAFTMRPVAMLRHKQVATLPLPLMNTQYGI
jgi:hypothetical protein